MRWATGVVGCRMRVAYSPTPLDMMCFSLEGQGYESLFLLSLSKVGVDVVEDVGRVWVTVAACEGLCSVLRCVAAVVERIVAVLVLACSALFVHAVMDGNPCRVGAGLGGRCVEQPLGCVVGVPRHRGVRVCAVQPWGYPCVGLWWHMGCGVGVVVCYEVQYGPRRCGCLGVTGPMCAWHALGVVGDL